MSDSVSSKEPSKEPSKEELIIPLIGNKEEDLLSPKTPPLAKKEKTLTGGNSSPKGRKSPKRLKSPIDPTPIFVNNKEVKRGDIPPILSPVNRRRGDKTAVKTSDKTEVKSSDKTSDNHFPDIADAKPDSFSPIPYIKNKEKDNETPFPNIPDNESNKKDFTDPHFYKVKYNSPGKHKKSGKSKTVKPEDNKADKLEDNKADKEKENIYKGSIHDLNPVPKSSFQQSVSITPIISPEVEKRKESPKKVENISPPKRPVSSVSRISKLPKPQTKVSSEHIGSAVDLRGKKEFDQNSPSIISIAPPKPNNYYSGDLYGDINSPQLVRFRPLSPKDAVADESNLVNKHGSIISPINVPERFQSSFEQDSFDKQRIQELKSPQYISSDINNDTKRSRERSRERSRKTNREEIGRDIPRRSRKVKVRRRRRVPKETVNYSTVGTLPQIPLDGRGNNMMKNRPDYDNMNPEEKEKYYTEFRCKFKMLEEYNKRYKAQEFPPGTNLHIIHSRYMETFRQIRIDEEVDNYKTYIYLLFGIIEIFLTKGLGLDASGYTHNQYNARVKYFRLLRELGESSYSEGGYGTAWPVEARIILLAIFNAIFFVVIKYLGPEIGGVIRSIVEPHLEGGDEITDGGTNTGIPTMVKKNEFGIDDISKLMGNFNLGDIGKLFGGNKNPPKGNTSTNTAKASASRRPRKPKYTE